MESFHQIPGTDVAKKLNEYFFNSIKSLDALIWSKRTPVQCNETSKNILWHLKMFLLLRTETLSELYPEDEVLKILFKQYQTYNEWPYVADEKD